MINGFLIDSGKHIYIQIRDEGNVEPSFPKNTSLRH